MALLDDLGTLIGRAASLSLPGVVAAIGLAVCLWPPSPDDLIEVAGICRNEACPIEWPPRPTDAPVTIQLQNPTEVVRIPLAGGAAGQTILDDASKPTCWTKLQHLSKQRGVFDDTTPVENQSLLDDQLQVYQQCQELEKAKQGKEDVLMSTIADRIKLLNTDLAKIDDSYQGYAASENPLENRFESKLEGRKREIQNWTAVYVKLQSIKQERTHRVDDYSRQQALLNARLSDPGRLRPRQRFDEFVGSLGTHVTGFVTLALGWSLLLTPVNQALLSLFYAAAYRDRWDSFRDNRGPSLLTLTRIAEQVSSAK